MMIYSSTDNAYMARALRLARRGYDTTHPNPRVGCVLVRAGQIVGEGWHERAGQPHAEVHALRMAGEAARGATAYVTLEPCCHYGRTPPCSRALLDAGVQRVVMAMRDPDRRVAGQGIAELQAAGVSVECGLLETEARTLNPGFVMRAEQGRPWVRCKLAMSVDGRTALASGASQWLTDTPARLDVQQLRASSSAVLTGIGTLLADDPALNVRLPETERQPLRVILDPELATPPQAHTLSLPGQVLILTTVTDAQRQIALERRGAKVQRLPPAPGGLDLAAVMAELARREINEVHTECGPILAGALLQAGLLDELVIYMAPVLLGHTARGLVHLPELASMQQRRTLTISDIRAVGRDWRITAHPISGVTLTRPSNPDRPRPRLDCAADARSASVQRDQ